MKQKKKQKKRETVGKASYDMQLKEQCSRDPIEIQRELNKNYLDELVKCVEDAKKEHHGDLFIVVITKKEPLMENVIRSYFSSRISCPTPQYDEAVYHYHRAEENIEFLWTVPDKGTCWHLRDHCLEVVPAEKELLNNVLSFFDGSLMRRCKKINGEAPDSPKIIT